MSDWISEVTDSTPRDGHRQAIMTLVDTMVKQGYTMQEIVLYISYRYAGNDWLGVYSLWVGEYFVELEEA